MPLQRNRSGDLGVAVTGKQEPTIVNHFHIASGVTSAELSAMVPALEQRILATVSARKRRPGGDL